MRTPRPFGVLEVFLGGWWFWGGVWGDGGNVSGQSYPKLLYLTLQNYSILLNLNISSPSSLQLWGSSWLFELLLSLLLLLLLMLLMLLMLLLLLLLLLLSVFIYSERNVFLHSARRNCPLPFICRLRRTSICSQFVPFLLLLCSSPSLVVNHTLSTTCYQPHIINHMLSTTHYQPHVINHMLSTTRYQPHVINHTSSTTRYQPYVINYTARVTRYLLTHFFWLCSLYW